MTTCGRCSGSGFVISIHKWHGTEFIFKCSCEQGAKLESSYPVWSDKCFKEFHAEFQGDFKSASEYSCEELPIDALKFHFDNKEFQHEIVKKSKQLKPEELKKVWYIWKEVFGND